MSDKKRSVAADFAVYCVVRLLVCVLQAMPYRVACACAGGLAWVAYHLDRRHREVARDNLRHAFPDLDPGQPTDELVRAVYRHFCTLLIHIVHTPRRLNTNTWRRYFLMEQVGPQIVPALLADRPLLLVTAHFGNWEIGGYALALVGFTTHSIARRLDNPFLHDFLQRFRERTGQFILDKNEDYDSILAVLASKGVLATLGDQDAGERGLFVDFFGRPASTHKAVALMALEYKPVVIVLGIRKVREPICYQLMVEDIIWPEEYDGQRDAVRLMTQRFTTGLERLIRRNPEQYFWLHRRWKHQPKPKKSKQAA